MGPRISIRVARRSRAAVPFLICVLFFSRAATASGRPIGKTSASAAKPCRVPEIVVDPTNDIEGVEQYKAAVRELFAAHLYADLDCLADTERASKAHFASGRWRLNVLYRSLEAPQGHATEPDWKEHIAGLNRWVAAKPASITARIALAQAYSSYAWDARGTGYTDTVTNNGWALFDKRTEKSRQILLAAAQLKAKCPQWYVAMQTVALGQSWDLARATQLLDQAIAFAPDYYYYYRNHANYLKPQWHGEEGDAERFAVAAADRVGGSSGDILYFQIAVELMCGCRGEPGLKNMSLPRIQRGVDALEAQNGRSLTALNLLAYMAVKHEDSQLARNAFERLGEAWNGELWKTRAFFDSSRSWAVARTLYQEDPQRGMIEKARVQFAASIRDCAKQDPALAPFFLTIKLREDGVILAAESNPVTRAGTCLGKLKGEQFLPPPQVPYAFTLRIQQGQALGE